MKHASSISIQFVCPLFPHVHVVHVVLVVVEVSSG